MADLIAFARGLIDGGAANGWQSFGQGSAWDSTERGQDIGLPAGTPVPGAAGTVADVASWGYGDSAVTERLPDGTLLTVGHVTPQVAPGQPVAAGQLIAYSRGLPSPISSGPHIEIRVQPGGGAFVDPVPWLRSAAETVAASSGTAAGAGPGLKSLLIGAGILAGLYVVADALLD